MKTALVALCFLGTSFLSLAEIHVGVGKRVVTPDPLLPVSGGIGPGREATKKLGELYARAMVMQKEEIVVAFVAVDFLGFPAALCDRVRARVPEIPGEHILIGASHTHSAPDCYGFPDEKGNPGCDMAYLDRVCALAAEAIREALETRVPARLKIATGEAKGQIAFNYYADQLYDPRCSVIQAIDESDRTIGTLVNYAIHPEVLGPKQGIVSPDVMGPLWERIESEAGGMALFMNGALGGMVTADVRGPDGEHRQTWEECQRIGRQLGSEALRIVKSAPFQEDPQLRCHTRRVRFPVESKELLQIIQLSPLTHAVDEAGGVTTQVNLVELGNARILTIPGEALPNIGYYLKRKLGGEHQLLFGLTNDAFGYILTKVDWGSFHRYEYITRTCLGEMTGEIFMEEALSMARALDSPGLGGEVSLDLLDPDALNLLGGPVSGSWLGVGWQEIDVLEEAIGAKGIRAFDLAPGGPAELAGLRRGDVVTHWNGKLVWETVADLVTHERQLEDGEKVRLKVFREGESRDLTVQAAKRSNYQWQAWRPGLPQFGDEAKVKEIFEASADELEALKRQFEALEAQLEKESEPSDGSGDGKSSD